MADRAQEPKRIANVLTIAGLDPSGGAGILADVKAMSACGTYGMAVVAALTAQNTCGVSGWQPVAPDFVRAQIDAIFEDIRVDAVKIGMLGTPEVIDAVAEALERHRPPFVVLDPVMVAKGGDRLLAKEAESALCERLLPLTTVITPNLPEAAVLAGEAEIRERGEMPALARKLLERLAPDAWVYLKGGHLTESADTSRNPRLRTCFFRARRRSPLKRPASRPRIRTVRAARSPPPSPRNSDAARAFPKPSARPKPMCTKPLPMRMNSVSGTDTGRRTTSPHCGEKAICKKVVTVP